MSEINSANWSETAASNNAAPPDGWPENQAPSTVNNCAREMMAALKRWYNRLNGTVTSGGAANAQTLTYTIAPAALTSGDRFLWKAGYTNTGAMTLNVGAGGALAVKLIDGTTDPAAGDVTTGNVYETMYDGTVHRLISAPGVRGAQPYDTDLAAIAALVSAADKVPYATGSGTWALADFTASGRALTAVSSIALGDLIYGSGSNAVSKLSGNTAATKKFLRMTGSGSAAAAPAWDTLVDGDIPAALTGKTYNGLTVTTSTGTLTIPNGATFAMSGAYSVTLTATNNTTLTLPTTGTLATLGGSETLTNKALNGSLGATTASTVAATTVDASGQITQTSTSNIFFVQSSAAATIRGTAFRTNGTERWRITCTADAESGSNVGSDYRIQRFSDAGSSLGSALIITRSTGVATFESSIVAGSAAATVIDSAGVVQLRSFTVATVPSASPAGREIYVSNESGGAITAFSDGTNWRRVSDRAIIS